MKTVSCFRVVTSVLTITGLMTAFFSPGAMATDLIPPCMAKGRSLPVNNAQILQWKFNTPNQFLARAHAMGRIQEIFRDKTGHEHFAIALGPNPQSMVEIVYNIEFGPLPNLALGMEVEACGDYITAKAQAGPYPPSPVGAIIHWVHINPNGNGHDSGFLVIDGNLYGNHAPNGPAPRNDVIRRASLTDPAE